LTAVPYLFSCHGPATVRLHDGRPQAHSGDLLFDGRKRTHHWDQINAQVAAEKLADYLVKANFIVMRGPPLPAHTADTSYKPKDDQAAD